MVRPSVHASRGLCPGGGALVSLTVLLLSPYLPPHLGGVERYVYGLAEDLVREHGCRVVLASPKPFSAREAQQAERELADINVPVQWLPTIAKISNTPIGAGWRRQIRRIATHYSVDIVNAHAPVPWLADMAARSTIHCPFILTYHAGALRKNEFMYDNALRLYESGLLPGTMRRAAGVICASEFVQKSLPQVNFGPQWIIPPAVDPQWWSPGGSARPGRILFVGSLDRSTRYKGLSQLLELMPEVMAEFPAATLEVVGQGDQLATYQRQAGALGVSANVEFSGALTGEKLLLAYQRAAVVALPSSFDNFPTVLVEALSVARPVVAYDVGAVRKILGETERGYLISANRPGEFLKAIVTVLADPVAAQARAERGRCFVQRELSVQRQGQNTMAAFLEVKRGAQALTAGAAIRSGNVDPSPW